jgi:hypothetical protein
MGQKSVRLSCTTWHNLRRWAWPQQQVTSSATTHCTQTPRGTMGPWGLLKVGQRYAAAVWRSCFKCRRYIASYEIDIRSRMVNRQGFWRKWSQFASGNGTTIRLHILTTSPTRKLVAQNNSNRYLGIRVKVGSVTATTKWSQVDLPPLWPQLSLVCSQLCTMRLLKWANVWKSVNRYVENWMNTHSLSITRTTVFLFYACKTCHLALLIS